MATKGKKRKADTANRQFLEQWENNYFMFEHREKMLCLICNASIAAKKEYNAKRHYETNHGEQYNQLEGEARASKISKLKRNLLTWQHVFI